MGISIADQYYIKALEGYPYDLETMMENLQYALGNDAEHAPALCLMGRLLMYVLKDYNKARSYFDEALKSDRHYPDTYEYLGQLYLWIGRYDMAEKVITYSLRITGVDHSTMLRLKSSVAEYQGYYTTAKHLLKQAKVVSSQANCIDAIDQDLRRIKSKSKFLKANKKATKKAKKAMKKSKK